MASNYPEFDERDRQMHADSEVLIARMTSNRDQLEAFHRDAKGRRKKAYEQQLASADKNLFEFRSSHEVFTDHLIERGVVPESKRGRRVIEGDTRTNAQKLNAPELSPGMRAVLRSTEEQKRLQTGAPGSAQSTTQGTPSPAEADPTDRHAASSQAGLSAHAGGQAKSLPSVPAPGQPGSRYRPVDVTHEEQSTRRDSAKGIASLPEKAAKKSLNIGAQRSLVEGVPPQVLKSDKDSKPDQGVAGAAAEGFANGALAGVKMNLLAQAQREPSADRGEAAERSTPETSRTADSRTADSRTAAPVRNASGQTVEEASSGVALEDALPGTTQPLALDVIDAAQGRSPKVVVMNPQHAAGLAALDEKESQRDEGFDLGGSRFGH